MLDHDVCIWVYIFVCTSVCRFLEEVKTNNLRSWAVIQFIRATLDSTTESAVKQTFIYIIIEFKVI